MGEFSFLANADPSSPESHSMLEMRRKIALQMMGQSGKKGYPKNIGEGLTAIGDSLGEIGMMRRLEAAEAARAKALVGENEQAAQQEAPARVSNYAPTESVEPAVAAINSAAAAPAAAPPEIAADDVNVDPKLNEAEMVAARASLLANPQQAAPPPVAQVAPQAAPQAGFRPAPTYLQAALDRNIQDPERRAFLGHLAGKEAQSASEVSPTGAKGPFQFTRGTGRDYGLVGPGGDRRADLDASIQAADKLTNDNAAILGRGLQRPPTASELALAHQQGAGTAVSMLNGTGNASARNLAVNNAGGGPQQAAEKIMAYYGMPGNSRDSAAAILATRAQPMTTADAASEGRFRDVVGLSKGDTGAYTYPPTASLGRTGDVMSDAPPPGVTGGAGGATGAGVADTVQQREQIIKALSEQQAPAPEVPQPNPTMAGPTAPTGGGNSPIVSDIQPAPAAGAQMAQAKAVPAPGAPPPPVAPATTEPRVPVPPEFQKTPPQPRAPELEPKSAGRLKNEQMLGRALALGDTERAQIYKYWIGVDDEARKSRYDRSVEQYKSEEAARTAAVGRLHQYYLDTPRRELEIKKMEDEQQQRAYDEGNKRRLGGISPEMFQGTITKSYEGVKGIPASAVAIENARQSLNDKMYTGSNAEINLTMHKLMAAAGFPSDPRIAATEAFKSYISPIIAQSRQALAGGANISDNDMKMAVAAAGGDIKLDKNTFPKLLDVLERLNAANAADHQKKLETFAGGDPERQRMLYGTYGLPMERIVPRAFAERLRQHADKPEAHQEFDDYFHTPGLSRRFIGK